jgi:hypothetical protein
MNWVEEVLRKYRLEETYAVQRVLAEWPAIAGERIARLSRALRLFEDTLWVETSSPSVAHELSFLEVEYTRRINELLGENVVRAIRFVPGYFSPEPTRKEIDLSAEDRERAKSLFREIKEERLRRSFERLYLTTLAREKSLLSCGGKRCPACGAAFTGVEEVCPCCRLGGIARTQGVD